MTTPCAHGQTLFSFIFTLLKWRWFTHFMRTVKRRTNLSLEPEVYDMAMEIMSLRKFSNITAFIETLIREEWERRHGPVTFGQQTRVAEQPIEYRLKKKKIG